MLCHGQGRGSSEIQTAGLMQGMDPAVAGLTKRKKVLIPLMAEALVGVVVEVDVFRGSTSPAHLLVQLIVPGLPFRPTLRLDVARIFLLTSELSLPQRAGHSDWSRLRLLGCLFLTLST